MLNDEDKNPSEKRYGISPQRLPSTARTIYDYENTKQRSNNTRVAVGWRGLFVHIFGVSSI